MVIKERILLPYVQKECENVQNNAGLLDLSTFAKYEISGKDSVSFLDRSLFKQNS